jgi:hypothetical protein
MRRDLSGFVTSTTKMAVRAARSGGRLARNVPSLSAADVALQAASLRAVKAGPSASRNPRGSGLLALLEVAGAA